MGISRIPCRSTDTTVAGRLFPVDCIQFMFMNSKPITGPDSMYATSMVTPQATTSASSMNSRTMGVRRK